MEVEVVLGRLHRGFDRLLQQGAIHPRESIVWIVGAVVEGCGLTGWWKVGTGRSQDAREEGEVVGSRLAGKGLLQVVLVRAGETASRIHVNGPIGDGDRRETETEMRIVEVDCGCVECRGSSRCTKATARSTSRWSTTKERP